MASKWWDLISVVTTGFMAYHVAIEEGLRRGSNFIGFGEMANVIAIGLGLISFALLVNLVKKIYRY